MTGNSRHRKTMLAGIATVMVIAVVFGIYRYSGAPRPAGVDRATDQSEQRAQPSDASAALHPTGEQAAVGDDSGVAPNPDRDVPRVTIGVSEAGIGVVAVEAVLQDVLDGLVDKALVEVSDLRPEHERLGDAAQSERRSFRISGSVDDVLHFVMHQYRYNYVLSGDSRTGSQAQNRLAKLFLYGTIQGEDPQSGDERYVAPASAEAVSDPDYAESKSDASAPETAQKDQATVSELLRNRALATRKSAASGSAAAVDDAPISTDFEDEATRARLAEMTRRASEQVRALATQLKAAEEDLEEQRANQYGDAVP
jgi:hypothetical protein